MKSHRNRNLSRKLNRRSRKHKKTVLKTPQNTTANRLKTNNKAKRGKVVAKTSSSFSTIPQRDSVNKLRVAVGKGAKSNTA